VLHGVQKYLPFITDDIVQAGVALAGGGADSLIGSCGAFSGGLMTLSARYSPRPDTLSDREQEQLISARRQFANFRDWFIAEFGSVACRDVQLRVLGRAFNITDERELEAFREYQKQSGRYCREVSKKAALHVAETILSEK
jgi:hypothetical protein